MNGLAYPTNEHYFQSQKAKDRVTAAWIAVAPSPYLAMEAGHSLRPHEVRPDWDELKRSVMLAGLRAKFSQNADLKRLLLRTDDAVLHEDSAHGFWGVGGKDMLGKLLMQVRDELTKNAVIH